MKSTTQLQSCPLHTQTQLQQVHQTQGFELKEESATVFVNQLVTTLDNDQFR